jgi:hypothetical protein
MIRMMPGLLCLPLLALSPPAPGQVTVDNTEVLGPFTGHDAPLHPDNEKPHPIAYYGTDLGFSYEHRGTLHFLFGDTWATEAYAPIETSTGARFDDGFGTIEQADWPKPGAVGPGEYPPIRLGQHEGSSEMSAIDPGHAMDLGHTPMAGFSNGEEQFALFNITKPQGCGSDADCGNGLVCDTGLGYFGTRFDQEDGLTLPCVDGMPMCAPDTVAAAAGETVEDTGFCIDRGSTVFADTPTGRVAAAGIRVLVGRRSESDPRKYPDTRSWLTNRFLNVTARTVDNFAAGSAGGGPKVLLWGRPGFIGVGANNRSLGLYFAYVDMPRGADFEWNVRYYTGTVDGVPQFSPDEADARPLDLDAGQTGVQTAEAHDIVQQMSVSWVEPLNKWIMLYGGGISIVPKAPLPNCGVLELFARFECRDVDIGNGAVRLRSADRPWGPWTAPQDVLVGGDPRVPGSGQFRPGGVLHHPDCEGETCADHTQTPYYLERETGFLYAANIIEEWTEATPQGAVLYWNASTWDPYRVVLARTRISK